MSLSVALKRASSTLDEIDLLKSAPKCSNQCSFKYQYREITSSLKCCIDQSGNMGIGVPAIKLSSQNLSETTNSPSAIFNDTEYWVSEIYISKPGQNIFSYKNTLNRSMEVDSCNNSCAVIVHHDKHINNYLGVYVPITTDSPNTSNGSLMLQNIITKINSEDISKCSDLTATTLSNQTLNLNTIIPTEKVPFYYFVSKTNTGKSINTGKPINMVVFSGQSPIYLSSSAKTNLENIFTGSSNSISKTDRETDITLKGIKVFTSMSSPQNSLTGGEEDDIYISCQPTDQSGELLEQGVPKGLDSVPTNLLNIPGYDPDKSMKDLFQDNMFVASIAGVVIMLILLKGAEFLMKMATKKALNEL